MDDYVDDYDGQKQTYWSETGQRQRRRELAEQ